MALRKSNAHMLMSMTTEQQYRDTAEEARKNADASGSPKSRRLWLEVARAYERLALPGKQPWHVERVERKK